MIAFSEQHTGAGPLDYFHSQPPKQGSDVILPDVRPRRPGPHAFERPPMSSSDGSIVDQYLASSQEAKWTFKGPLVELRGFEPLTSAVQERRSPN